MKREAFINGERVGEDTDGYVIAEIGHNHQGSLQTAKEVFRQANGCEADSGDPKSGC